MLHSKIYKLEDGTLNVTDGRRILGGLIPVEGKENKYTIRMGSYGGFYNEEKSFDDALSFLCNQLVSNYTAEIESVRRGAICIYKKSIM